MRMDVADAIRTRRTHKAFGPEPVPAPVLRELLELARWAPNHHVTDPWRFRVLGPAARERLKAAAEAAKPGSGGKLDRAPTLAGYWRTLGVLDEPAGRAAVHLPGDETPLGLLHLGEPRQEQRVPPRAPVEQIAEFLD
jgi:nitroreductase